MKPEEKKTPPLLGVELGKTPGQEHGYPGLSPMSQKLDTIKAELNILGIKAFALDQIRATLLLNFSAGNQYGVEVSDIGNTLDMLMTVLNFAFRVQPFGASSPERTGKNNAQRSDD